MDILGEVIERTEKYIEEMPKCERKKYGQFFTSKETATFMASLFSPSRNKEEITILDPGAGSGVLSAAIIERLQNFLHLKKIRLVCYENDTKIFPLLRENLKRIIDASQIPVAVRVEKENYILSQSDCYNDSLFEKTPERFDLIIGNPPYMKIAKDAPEAHAMPDICHGAPNLYFLFAGMSLFQLKEQGEMVYIIPRSWTSGAYFQKFREKFLTDGSLVHIHLFESRNKVFDKENVLQETMIIKVRKTQEKPDMVKVTTTRTNRDFSRKTEFLVPYDLVVSEKEKYVYLVTNAEEAQVLHTMSGWRETLPTIGLRMKTGLTVDFRNREVLRNQAGEGAVPLFYSQHIQEGKIRFPVGKGHEYIGTECQGLLQKNTNYLFVKRFTAKEEHRRLQCGVYLSKKYAAYPVISTQNKINFICGNEEMSDCLVYGLYVLFNSSLYDAYYRILNGSTQVNSTEINTMPVPPRVEIEAMGRQLMKAGTLSETACDEILEKYV